MFKEKSFIAPLLIGCQKNDRRSQKQLFFSLYEFALRICFRYSGIHEDPTIPMHEGFVRLFKNIQELNYNADPRCELTFKNWFKEILIDCCIEYGKHNCQQIENNLPVLNGRSYEMNGKDGTGTLSAKAIIDSLRSLSFPCRTVFNLSVIDGYNREEISSKLQIPVTSVEYCLERARAELNKLFPPLSLSSSA